MNGSNVLFSLVLMLGLGAIFAFRQRQDRPPVSATRFTITFGLILMLHVTVIAGLIFFYHRPHL